ncbi:DUF916 domain-containing protein [Bacillus seohaeanensis]|jgi:hypothetical protein|uniref:WxL protein peptidoglycan domain-containing protein n=1 Tax=Bacillus seohaeanensis TaxID=284580 RepID=A0ABW5RR54_9BACI
MKKASFVKTFIYLITIILLSCFDYSNIRAQEPPLTIEPIYPDNQHKATKGYFDLSVNPGEKLNLKVKIINNEDKDVTVTITPANAFTSPTGGMMYEQEAGSENTRLLDDAVRLAEYIDVKGSVTVSPHSAIEVPIAVNTPKVKGENALGGLLFTMQGEKTEKAQEVEKGTANFILKTETVYAIALQLNFLEEVPSNYLFGESGFHADTAQVYIEMLNDANKIEENVSGNYTVTNQSGEELFSGRYGPFKMAPNSWIRFPMQWGHDTLDDGTYTLTMDGTAGDSKVTTSKTFKIANKDVEQYVEKNETKLPTAATESTVPTWVWVGGAILFGLIMFFIGRRKK